ncbi:MAG: HDIG domain-containing protein [Synechococcales cyanobacterium M58_A2018_015]|nr:HDIG domain-containing protein [Synechococcales cyanobacterium M58_A2018_015]
MKPFRLLPQRIAQWRQAKLSSIAAHPSLRQAMRQVVAQANRCKQAVKTSFLPQQAAVRCRMRLKPKKHRPGDYLPAPILLAVAVLSLTSVIGYRFYNEPQLGADTIAPQTLRAPSSARVVDEKTTEANRKAARTAAIPVLTINQAVNQEIYRSLQRLLDQGDELRRQAGAFPFVDTSVLSTATQQYLRQTEEWNWRIAIATTDGIQAPLPPTSPPSDASNSALQVAILELQNYRRSASAEDFSALNEVLLRARQRYADAVATLSSSEPDGSTFYDAELLQLTDAEWSQARTAIRLGLERILTQGIAPGLPNSILEMAVKAQLEPSLPTTAVPLATRILLHVLEPNLQQDPAQTKLRAEQAAQAVEDIVVEIRRGEVIVQAGERISQSDFVLLDYFGLSRRRINWWGLIGLGSIISAAVATFLIVERSVHPGLRRRDHVLVLLLTLSAPLMLALQLPSTNLPAIGLLVGSFYGSALGTTTVALLSLVLPIGIEMGWTHLVASAAGGLLGAIMAGQLRSREELALLGGGVGLTQGVVYLILSLSAATTPVWYIVLTMAGVQGLMGIAWSVVALGISPYLEHVFDLVTPIRLAELSNPNRPMLKRLASEAPGTFQHTLFVATLAEAAARALGCNVELVRAGTLYHDIGKMHDPLGFIENQMGGPNKHDTINDPWQSAAIIKKHVSEGLVMARKCRLPTAIQAFIPEHQGTMPISYFYHQAQQQAQSDATLIVNEADFRYDGPIPQSRETGIVMLADSCEAALRSLKDASPEEALAMVNRILRARWQDNQLVDSGLSRSEMTQIAEIFVQVWQQFNHQRIPYPRAALNQPSVNSRAES